MLIAEKIVPKPVDPQTGTAATAWDCCHSGMYVSDYIQRRFSLFILMIHTNSVDMGTELCLFVKQIARSIYSAALQCTK